jgi:hypothetical protein
MVRRSSPSTPSAVAALPRATWEETLEAEPVDRHPGHRQRHEHRGRPRNARHTHPARDRGAHEAVPGVRDRRHPGIRHDDDAATYEQLLDELGRALRLVVLVVGQHAAGGLDLEGLAEATQPTGVLGGDDVGRAQLFGQTGRRVARIADGGGCQDEDTTATGAAAARTAPGAAAAVVAHGRDPRTVPSVQPRSAQVGRSGRPDLG